MQTEPTSAERAYAAGFFDGEGCVLVSRRMMMRCRSPIFGLRAQVTQDDIRPLVWMQRLWGGFLRPRKIRINGGIAHDLTLQSRSAVYFLEQIQPFLIVKAEQVALALEMKRLQYNPGRHGYTKTEIVELDRIRDELTYMKTKHPNVVPLEQKQSAS